MSQLKKSPKKKSKSVLKRERQNLKRRERNKQNKSRVKTFIKKFREMLKNKSLEEAKNFIPKLEKEIDVSVRKGAIHWKTGARYKSRLMKAFNKLLKETAIPSAS